MPIICLVLILILGLASAGTGLNFIRNPTLSKDGSGLRWVEFEVDQATDVAVSIVSLKDSTVIRNLAAGVLGANAPAPLAVSTFHQKLAWDGKNNYGQPVTLPDSLIRGRVRAGMAPKLSSFVGGDPYIFASTFNGIRANADGSVFVAAGHVTGINNDPFKIYNDAMTPIRRFDVNGNYIETVFPPRANLPLDSVSTYGINVLGGGLWAPKAHYVSFATMTRSLLNSCDVQLLSSGGPGELILVNGTSLQTIRTSGAAAPQDTPRTLVPAGGGYSAFGSIYYSASHDPRHLYLSGKFFGRPDPMGGFMQAAYDTGFWADGQVFKVDKSTGQVMPWLAVTGFPTAAADRIADIGDGGFFSVFHGVDIDDSGRVFVCDRFNKRVSVYDTNKVLLGSVPIRWPDGVRVNRRTGELYVATRTTKAVTLYKFSGWRGVTLPSYSVPLANSEFPNRNQPTIVITETGGQTMVTVGASASSYGTPMYLRIYSDDGAKFTFVKDFLKPATNNTLIDFNRIAVDRRNETVYIQNCIDRLFKIENWANPVVLPCSTASRQPLLGDDMAIDPRRGLLYVREVNPNVTLTHYPVNRYTLDHLHSPVPYANTGKHTLATDIGSGDVIGHPTRGMDVSQIDGNLIINFSSQYSGYHLVSLFSDTGRAAFDLGKTLIRPIPGRSGGAKFDLQGNFYVGTLTRSPDHIVPGGYLNDPTYEEGVGAIVKYPAGSSGLAIGNSESWRMCSSLPLVKTTAGADRVYAPGFSPFGKGSGTCCSCRSPRFDVDFYGRLFIPNAVTKEVTVTDNNDNVIVKFGQYGNVDSWGGLPGPGAAVPGPAFPLAFPVSAAASEDFIYVGDMVNWRMMRVKMDYLLDNFPNLTSHGLGVSTADVRAGGGLALAAAPNPFNPNVTIFCTLPARAGAVYRIYNSLGRIVFNRSLAATVPGGTVKIQWNGRDTKGVQGGSGFFAGKLATSDGKMVTHKLMLLK